MSQDPLHFSVSPIFCVKEDTVSVDKMQVPYWKDEFAACFMFDLHHQGPGPFREGLWAMKSAWLSRPSHPVVETPLYDELLRIQGLQLDDSDTLVFAHRNQPVSDFISEMANRARFQDRVPTTYSELKRDLSGGRRSVL
jgi:hypothetical protein